MNSIEYTECALTGSTLIKNDAKPENDTTKISGIYLLKNKINGKVYVGKSLNIKRRWNEYARDEHTNYPKHTQPVINSIRKYGWQNFDKSIIECPTKNQLLERESYWIKHYSSLDRTKGYNICEFSCDATGYKHSLETRLKMSIAGKGKKHNISDDRKKELSDQIRSQTGPGNLNPMFGKYHSLETKQKISNILKEKYRSGEIKGMRPINQFDKDGNFIKTWRCIRDASKNLTGNYSRVGHICNVCRGIAKTAVGFKWKYVQ